MKTDCQTHILALASGRIEYRIRFTTHGIFAVLEAPGRLNCRRERRMLQRWQEKIHRPLNADPRPLSIITMIAGEFSRLGIEQDGGVLVFGEALP
jgi:hypothetical protein